MDSEIELQPLALTGGKQDQQPVIIAGPCSAETEEQVMNTAHALKERGVSIYRAGIWKPRTRPGAFQGVGTRGLPWLQKARQETGMKMAIEVATPGHVEEALAHHIDVVWIGARTTANPFAVEEIARALRGTDIPMLVKNPISPDLSLWIGAVERFHKNGIKRIGAVHRGFSCYSKSQYRNPPQWNIPMQLKEQMPGLPVLHDPSHTAGQRHLVHKTAKKALGMNMDGLMVEVHTSPEEALSDSRQQLTPDMFANLMKKLGIRTSPGQAAHPGELQELRKRIDELDDALLNIMSQRMQISQEIGHVKKKHRLGVFQKDRWQKIISQRIASGRQKGMSRRFIESVFENIHQESLLNQENEGTKKQGNPQSHNKQS